MNVPPLLGQTGDEVPDSLGVAHVQLHREDLDAIANIGRNVGGERLQLVDTARGQDEAQVALGTGARKFAGGGPANAGGGAGDEDGLAGQALARGGERRGRHGSGARRCDERLASSAR